MSTTPSSSSALNRFTDRVALITGGANGIGLATAHRLAQEGATVVIADHDAAAVTASAQAGGFEARVLDVTDAAHVRETYQEVAATFGRLDVALHNAGIAPPEDGSVLDEPNPDLWQRVMDVNVSAVLSCSRAALEVMVPQGRGSIINSASFVAVMGMAISTIAYTTSKGAVLAMTREMGVEFARTGVRINALCPGPIETPLLTNLLQDQSAVDRRMVHIPLGRFGKPEEVAAAAAFLASDDASYITAATFLVDGGMSAAYVTPE